jgi:hypothetical protein
MEAMTKLETLMKEIVSFVEHCKSHPALEEPETPARLAACAQRKAAMLKAARQEGFIP